MIGMKSLDSVFNMALGLGKRYFVQILDIHYGDLDSCIEFMKANPPQDSNYWYELNAQVKVKKGQRVTCNTYQCLLVTDDHY